MREKENGLRREKEQVREKELFFLRSIPSSSDSDLVKQLGRMKLDLARASEVNLSLTKTLSLVQSFPTSAVELLNVEKIFGNKKIGVPAKVPRLEMLDAALRHLLVDGKEESAVQTLMVELLTELCVKASLRLEDTHAKPVRGYPRRPDICVLENSVVLTIREVKLTVELKIRGLLRDARKQVEEYLREQALQDAGEHRTEYLGVGCDGFEVQFCRLYCEGDKWKFAKSEGFPLWENNVVGGSIDLTAYQLLFLALCKVKTLPDRTSVGVCSDLQRIVRAKKARFGLISAGKRDGDNLHHHVVYWSDHGEGFILKGYGSQNEADRELSTSIKARESLTRKLKRHVPVVERLESHDIDEKIWLKLTPLGLCSLAECNWLFGLLPLEASEEQRVDLFMALKGHFQTVETVLLALHEKGVFHCDVKPSNIVLMHKDKGLTEARLAKTLVPMLIDFSALGDVIATTVWFASRALLLDSGSDPCSGDDLESLFWTAVEVLSRGTFISSLRAVVREKGGDGSPAKLDQESTQQERSINELVIECRSVFLAELAGNERDGRRLANMLFLSGHSFEYLREFAERLSLHRVYA